MGTVLLYATLRQRADGQRAVEVPWSPGDRIDGVLRDLLRRKPGLEGYILDDAGKLLPYVNVFLDGRDIRYLSGLDTPLDGETEVSIFPPVAGGQAVSQVTFGGVPAWLLAAYLVELGGTDAGEGVVIGHGWTARLQAGTDGAGHIRIGRVTVSVEGPAADSTMAALRRKAQRGGG